MIHVTCAIICRDGKTLAAQRGPNSDLSGQWEFPGGKVDANESEEECIRRELCEELGVDVLPLKRLKENIHDYGDKQIRLIPFVCDLAEGEPVAAEHAAIGWFTDKELASLNWCEADLPIVGELLSS